MLRNTLIALVTLPLAINGLATKACAQEAAVRGLDRAEAIDARIGSKIAFVCTGEPTDLVVIRLADGSIYASGTLAEMRAGLTRGSGGLNAVVAQRGAMAGRAMVVSPTKPGELVSAKPLPETASRRMAPIGGLGTNAEPVDLSTEATQIGQTADTEPEFENTTKAATLPANPNVPDEPVKQLDFALMINQASMKFHNGSIALYHRGSLVDADRIRLH